MDTSTRIADRDDLDAIGQTLGAAFEDDPVMRWLVGEHRTDVKRVGCLYRAIAAGHLDDGLCTLTSDTEAVAVWAAPRRYIIPPRRFVPYLPCILRALGFRGLMRLPDMTALEKLHPREPHYYLAVLGTHPHHQGRGRGTAAMAPMLEQADADHTACYLESSKEQNLVFYARHGFEVTGTHDLDGGSGPRLWLMWREPRPPERP